MGLDFAHSKVEYGKPFVVKCLPVFHETLLTQRCRLMTKDDLVETDEKVVVKESEMPGEVCVELVWRERLPLGMNLLMNDDSGFLKVVDFPRGSQARAVCERRGLDPEMFKGATIVGVNGSEYEVQEDLFEALKDPSRPKTVRFRIADPEDAERIRKFVEGGEKKANGKQPAPAERIFQARDVEFIDESDLGIEFGPALDNVGLVVRRFIEGDGGIVLAAEKSGQIKIGDLLTKINHNIVLSEDGSGSSRAIRLLEDAACQRPLTLTFVEPYLHPVTIESTGVSSSSSRAVSNGGPHELLLKESVSEKGGRRIVLTGFQDVSGVAESSGIFIGDHLVFINGMPVGAGCRWFGVNPPPSLFEVHEMLRSDAAYPMGLTFARPRISDARWGGSPRSRAQGLSDHDADTFCVALESYEQLGCIFNQDEDNDITVVDFPAVPGVFQRVLRPYQDSSGRINLSIHSLNGQFVPSYASIDMVKSAINRSWKNDTRVEMWLCDDAQKSWILNNSVE